MTAPGFGQSGTFTYTPDISVYVNSSVVPAPNNIINVSPDVLDGQVQLLIDQPSTFNCNLNNSGKKYDGIFNRLDPIVVFLKRTSWVQVMAGYITQVPILTRMPTPVTLSASCSLLKLQDTWWDVGTLSAQSKLPGFLSSITENIFSDEGIADSILELLTQVSNWNPSAVHIQAIPTAFLNYASKVANGDVGSSTDASVLAAYLDAQGMYAGITPSTRFTSKGISYATQPAGLTPSFNTAGNNSLPVKTVGTALTANSQLNFIKPGGNTINLSSYQSEENDFVMTGPFGWESTVSSEKGTADWIASRIVVFSKNSQSAMVILPGGTSSDGKFHLSSTAMTYLGAASGDTLSMAYVTTDTPLGEYDLTGGNYNQVATPSSTSSSTGAAPSANPANPKGSGAAAAAIGQIGVPYVWGDETVGKGFDCSGLSQYVWSTQGVQIPRVADDQWKWNGGKNQVPANVALQVGDLVYFRGSDGSVTLQTTALPVLTPNELMWCCLNLTEPKWINDVDGMTKAATATAICMGVESSGVINATGLNGDGSIDRGLWQINTKAHPTDTNASVYTIQGNVQAMQAISTNGTNWDPWPGAPVYDIDQPGIAALITKYEALTPSEIYAPPSTVNTGTCYLPPQSGGVIQGRGSPSMALLESQGGQFPTNAQASGSSVGGTAGHVGVVVAPPGLADTIDGFSTSTTVGIMVDAPETGENVKYQTFDISNAGLSTSSDAYYMGAMRPTGVTNASTTNNSLTGVSASGGSGTAAAAGFNVSGFDTFSDAYGIPQFNSVAQVLYGSADGFIADDTLLDTLQQLCGSTMRHIQSAPNGDFVAFFADYYGLWTQTPAMKIEDIEITDFRLYANDANITTHVAVVGDPTGLGQGTNLADYLTDPGIVSIQTKNIGPLIFGPHFDASQFNIAAFMNRYGIRPYLVELPSIQDPILEFMFALFTFLQKWADQYESTISTTFLPEVYPGMIVQFPSVVGSANSSNPTAPLQVYVTSVVHTVSRSSGYTTEMTVTCPTFGGIPLEFTRPTTYTKTPQKSQ